MEKWNYKTHNYDPYEVPIDWNCKTYSEDMNEIINCASCGRKIRYGNCYTSKEIHTSVGFGYGVCSKCYEKEWQHRGRW